MRCFLQLLACPICRSVCAILFCGALLACPEAVAQTFRVDLQVVDSLGVPLPARVHVRDALDRPYPGYPDSLLLSHSPLGSYFYIDGSCVMELCAGVADITVGHGFEWIPVHMNPLIQRDTTLVVVLEHAFDLRADNWYGGDTHVHTQHEPMSYPVPPEAMHLIARAEDLAQVFCLDQSYEFTGAAHAVSTPEATLYYATEYRNGAYGHVALLGLKEMRGVGCCHTPEPACPMLSDTHTDWGPLWDEAMSLAHPHTGAGFFDDQGWPGSGLGRELPVLGALGHLDALDITAYTNEPDIYLLDWYRLLNCGLRIPPSAGTDACVASYYCRPAGGYRVYVKEPPGIPHTSGHWVAALESGSGFVTNYPLIPHFTVGGTPAGGTLELTEPGAVAVAFSIRSVLPLERARVVRGGCTIAVLPLPAMPDGTVAVDTTLQLTACESSWFAMLVEGQTDLRHAVDSRLFAHTGAVYVQLNCQAPRSTGDAGFFMDWIDNLETFVEVRGNWPGEEEHRQVLARLDSARDHFGRHFQIPPQAFDLLAPADGDTLYESQPAFFDWTDALDPEYGDRVDYALQICADSTFSESLEFQAGYTSSISVLLPPPWAEVGWWRVRARDRGGNMTTSSPACCWFHWVGFADLAERTRSPEAHLLIQPNPSQGCVHCYLPGGNRGTCRLHLLDLSGRAVARWNPRQGIACGFRAVGAQGLIWNGSDRAGRRLPNGRYWFQYAACSHAPGDVVTRPVLFIR